MTAFRFHYAAVARALIAAGAREDVYSEMKADVALVLTGRRGGGYPDAGEGADRRDRPG
jgi:hypothetical protein